MLNKHRKVLIYMTHTEYTKNILNIKDENIYFYENCLEIKKIKGIDTKVFHGILSYEPPQFCPCCGCVNENNSIIKWAFKKNCRIKLDKVSNFNTILLLDKQRFLCKNCNSTFISSTSLVDYNKQISNNTKVSIILDLMEKGNEKDIAKRHNVSSSTINRILDEISKDKMIKNNGHLPSIIGIDEFKATTDTKSKMAFIIVDQNNKNIFDILDSRMSDDIEKYFKRYSRQERMKVEFITLDLYKPYYKLMHKLFPNAILVPDRFHIVIQARNALDKTRIKQCKKSNPNYRKLKKYWKLILKDENNLDDKKKFYSPYFRKEVTQKYIVTYLINTNKELKVTYNYYQGILKSIDKRDKDLFLLIINNLNKDSSKYIKKANKTFLDMKTHILNALKYEYSNGIVEGTNNLIKQIKHAACGYRKFKHLKARIMLVKGLLNPIKYT